MTRHTILISNPANLWLKDLQMHIHPEGKNPTFVPVSDLAILMLEHPRIYLSTGLIGELAKNNVMVLTCDEKHLPVALITPVVGHHLQSERWKAQLELSLPTRKRCWQQTVAAKILNQYQAVININPASRETPEAKNLLRLAGSVLSNDSKNNEAQAARLYFSLLFGQGFLRHADGGFPNNALNYAYAVLRASMARAIVATGLLPTFGIFHHNKYNPFCLADDLMEPYRPLIDLFVAELIRTEQIFPEEDLSPATKRQLLRCPYLTCFFPGYRYPNGMDSTLQNAVLHTAQSLVRVYLGNDTQILYPRIPDPGQKLKTTSCNETEEI
jgi:CRISPR-associated protein Cas1